MADPAGSANSEGFEFLRVRKEGCLPSDITSGSPVTDDCIFLRIISGKIGVSRTGTYCGGASVGVTHGDATCNWRAPAQISDTAVCEFPGEETSQPNMRGARTRAHENTLGEEL